MKELTLEPYDPTVKFIDLPKALIGDISSYLKSQSHSLLSRVCRKLYINLQNPSTLQEVKTMVPSTLSEIPYCNYDHDIRNKYPLLRSLDASAPYLTHYMNVHDNEPFNHLYKLRLFQVVGAEILNNFLDSNNLINYPDVTNLTCENFIEYVHGQLNATGQILMQQEFDSDLFYNFIALFTNLEQLQFYQVQTQWNEGDIGRIKEIMPNLKRFASADSSTSLVNAIINCFGHQLECLGLSNQDCRNIDARLEFSELKELSLMSPSYEVTNHIVSTTKKLERFGISLDSRKSMTDEQMLSLLIKIMKGQKHLDYVGFDVSNGNYGQMINIIKSALSATCDVPRAEFKIGLNVMFCPEGSVISAANHAITHFIEVFERSNIESYMIDLAFYSANHEVIDDKRQRLKIIRSLSKTHLVACEDKSKRGESIRFIVSNLNCKINGYRAKWLLYN